MRGKDQLPFPGILHDLERLTKQVFKGPRIQLVDGQRHIRAVISHNKQVGKGNDRLDSLRTHTAEGSEINQHRHPV